MRILAACLALLMLLTACAKKVPTRADGAGQPPADSITISVLVPYNDGALDALIAGFYEQYPNVRINKVSVQSGGNMAELMRMRIRDGEVDVVPVGVGLLSKELLDEQMLLALDPFIQKSRFDLKPLGAGVEGLRHDGKLYELPYVMQPWIILYNQDQFQAKGVPLPRGGWTWDQFREAAVKLTEGEGENKVWGLVTHDVDLLAALYMVQRAGEQYMTDERALAEALPFFSTLVFGEKAIPASRPMESQASGAPPYQDHFHSGRAAMTLESIQSLTWMRSLLSYAKFKWDVAPVPVIPGAAGGGAVNYSTYGIAAKSRQPDAAWQFIQYATGPEGAAALARAGFIPVYRSPQVKQAWFERLPAPPPGTEALFDLEWRPMGRTLDRQSEIPRNFITAVNGTLSGKMSWEQAHTEFVRELRRLQADGGR